MDYDIAEVLSRELFVSQRTLVKFDTSDPFVLRSGILKRKTTIYTLKSGESSENSKTIFVPSRESMRKVARWSYHSRSAWWKALFWDIDLYVRGRRTNRPGLEYAVDHVFLSLGESPILEALMKKDEIERLEEAKRKGWRDYTASTYPIPLLDIRPHENFYEGNADLFEKWYKENIGPIEQFV